MGVLENYKNEIVNIVDAYVNEYEKLGNAVSEAEKKLKAYPKQINGLDAEHKAKAFRAKADFEEAQEAYREHIRNGKNGFSDSVNEIRQKALEHIESKFMADPLKVDNAMLELIKSGICNPAEYAAFMKTAKSSNNGTMMRLIAKYARTEAEKFETIDAEKAKHYRLIANEGTTANGSEYANAFNSFVSIVKRIEANPRLYRDARILEIITNANVGNI